MSPQERQKGIHHCGYSFWQEYIEISYTCPEYKIHYNWVKTADVV
jgi:predicted Zn-ribbon and HTH transcriptional regulator